MNSSWIDTPDPDNKEDQYEHDPDTPSTLDPDAMRKLVEQYLDARASGRITDAPDLTRWQTLNRQLKTTQDAITRRLGHRHR
jgi:hypothetical protein